jgi:hypothetical protein
MAGITREASLFQVSGFRFLLNCLVDKGQPIFQPGLLGLERIVILQGLHSPMHPGPITAAAPAPAKAENSVTALSCAVAAGA